MSRRLPPHPSYAILAPHERRPRGSGPDVEREQERKRAWWHRNKDKKRGYKKTERLKVRYGLTPQQYDEMVVACGNRCEVCLNRENRVENGEIKALGVDHDHSTKKVRGLLCYRCNLALGLLQDDLLRIEALADYLRRAQ